MQIQISGKHMDVGDALRSRIEEELTNGISKYFERGGNAEVTLSKEGHMFRADCWVRLASGQTLVSHAYGGDAHGAFDGTLDRIEKRIRRYKSRLKDHHAANRHESELAPMMVLRQFDDHDDVEEVFEDHVDGAAHPPEALVIADTEAKVRTMTVSMAVMELDLSNYPVILFRNAAHGGLSVVYRRPDGNIGWIDPERTRSSQALAETAGRA